MLDDDFSHGGTLGQEEIRVKEVVQGWMAILVQEGVLCQEEIKIHKEVQS